MGDDFSLPPKTAWLLRFAPVFRTGRSVFRSLLLRTPAALIDAPHDRYAEAVLAQNLELVLFGFYVETSLARQTLVAEVLRT